MRVSITFLNQKSNYLCFPNGMCEHYIENTLIVSILVRQTLCLMRLPTEKETHAATSGCKLTTDHRGGESEALFSSSTNSQMWCRWLSQFWPGLGSSYSREGHGQDLGFILCHLRSLPVVEKGNLFLGQGVPGLASSGRQREQRCGAGSELEGVVAMVCLWPGQAHWSAVLHVSHSLSFEHFCY